MVKHKQSKKLKFRRTAILKYKSKHNLTKLTDEQYDLFKVAFNMGWNYSKKQYKKNIDKPETLTSIV